MSTDSDMMTSEHPVAHPEPGSPLPPPLAAPRGPLPPPTGPTAGGADSSRRRRSIGIAAAIGALAVGGIVGGAFLLGDDDDEATRTPATPAEEPSEPAAASRSAPAVIDDDAGIGQPAEERSSPSTPPAPAIASDTSVASVPSADGEAGTRTADAGAGGSESISTERRDLGERALIGERWAVTVNEVDVDATDRIVDADPENRPPPPGSTFVLVSLDVEHLGAGDGEPYFELLVGAVDGEGREYTDIDCIAYGPDDFYDLPAVPSGDRLSGSFCLVVPEPSVADLDVFVEEHESSASTRVWWSLG